MVHMVLELFIIQSRYSLKKSPLEAMTTSQQPLTLFWFRRDLRWTDNHGFYEALMREESVLPIFIYDKHIIDELPEQDNRLIFIHRQLDSLREKFEAAGGTLRTFYATPQEAFEELFDDYHIAAVYTNADYEPYAIQRDSQIAKLCADHGAQFQTYKDQVIFHQDEVMTGQDTFYSVFTPYKKRWLKHFEPEAHLRHYRSEDHLDKLWQTDAPFAHTALEAMGHVDADVDHLFPEKALYETTVSAYDDKRNFPAVPGTSRLGVHLRFGTLSIRRVAENAMQADDYMPYLNELIWREFYMQVLYHNPHVVNHAFREKYDAIEWENNEAHFEAWQQGQTGYPMVDAGMRELNATGYMHNRVRMVVASFLTKHLLIDWRWGEAYFAEKLLDYELSSNNGGWQWAAGSGTDAAPYFRIFNPESQLKKFDPQKQYVKRWVPEFGTDAYPEPIVEHKWARERCLERYKAAM